jgi:dipeptidyl aminopeptidase/acylaminoacyl peptidase
VKPPAGVNEIEYRSGELRLKAWISQPDDAAKKQPAVLFLHGGFAFDYPDDWDASQPYRDAGFVVMTPMLRSENGQPGAFSFFYDEVDDALAAAESLRQLPYVDADKLFIAGPSAGGTVALLAAMTSKLFRAAASFSATPDQVVFCKHARDAAKVLPFDITDHRELELRSPLAYAASLKCPTRLYVGREEPEFQATTRMTAEVAKKKKVDAEATIVDGDHGSSVLPAVKLSIEFFRRQ